MSLAVDVVKSSFSFVRKYPVSLLFSTILIIVTFAASLVSSGVFVQLTPTSPTILLTGSNLSQFVGASIVITIIGIIVALIQAGGYPLMALQGLKKKKIMIAEIFKGSFSRIGKVFVVWLILSLIMLIPVLSIMGLSFFAISSMVASDIALGGANILANLGTLAVLGIVGFVIAVYLNIRFFLALPVLMLENRGPVESLKESWKSTKGLFWSILATLGLFAIIALPITLSIGLVYAFLGTIGLALNIIYAIVFSVVVGILPTIYYFKIKKR